MDDQKKQKPVKKQTKKNERIGRGESIYRYEQTKGKNMYKIGKELGIGNAFDWKRVMATV